MTTPTEPPHSEAARITIGGLQVRLGRSIFQRVAPWIAPFVAGLALSVVGYVKGYYEGLAAAGRRVAAVEEAARLNAEGDARSDKRFAVQLDRVFIVLDDHDSRIPKVERQLARLVPPAVLP